MKLDEYKNKKIQIYSKVLFNTKVKKLIELFTQLSCELSIYFNAYKSLRFLREDTNSKRKDLEDKIDSAKKEIVSIYNKIDKLFNGGFFQELTKEQAIEISDEYQYLVEAIINISVPITKDPAWQKFTDLINDYENIIIPRFEIINDNIEIYNKRVDEEHWKYKLRTYDEAIDYHNKNYAIVEKNHKHTTSTEWQKINFDK